MPPVNVINLHLQLAVSVSQRPDPKIKDLSMVNIYVLQAQLHIPDATKR